MRERTPLSLRFLSCEAAAVFAILGAGQARGQIPAPLHVVPIVGNLGGGSEHWKAELVIANLGAAPVSVGVRFFRENVENTFDGTFPHTVTLQPGETSVLGDLLESWFPQLRSSRGWMLVADATAVDCTVTKRPYPALLAVSLRLHNPATPSAGYGTAVPVSWTSINAGRSPSLILGVQHPGGEKDAPRAFVAAANLSAVPLPIRIRFLGANRTVGQADRVVPALSLGFWSLEELGIPPLAGTLGRLEVALADDGNAWDPCKVAQAPPPCADPCNRKTCPQRYRLPASPMFAACAVQVDPAGSAHVLLPVIDQVGAAEFANRYVEKHCPEMAGTARVQDLVNKLIMRRDPATLPQ